MNDKSAGEPIWHTRVRCESGTCVEVAARGKSILIRNAADPDGLHVTLTRDEWQMFVARVKDGEFDSI